MDSGHISHVTRGSTIKSLAAALGLSTSTISRALAGHTSISAQTRARVVEAAQAAGYAPSPTTGSLARSRTIDQGQRLTGCFLHIYGYPFEFEAQWGFLPHCRKRAMRFGFNLVACHIKELESFEALSARMTHHRASGFILTMDVPSPAWMESAARSFPCVDVRYDGTTGIMPSVAEDQHANSVGC